MLIELLIAMVVLAVGLGGVLIMLASSMYTNSKAGNDTTSTMLSEHVMEQITAQPANAVAGLTVTDCTGAVWNVTTTGATKGAGNAGANGGNGASLTANASIDWTQAYGNVPAGYAMQYVACGAGGRQMTYDVRWDVITMSTYSRMVFVSARPANSQQVGGLRYIVPVTLRTIGGM